MRFLGWILSVVAVTWLMSFALANAADSTGSDTRPRAGGGGICKGYGPQSPRDISKKSGINRNLFTLAPPYQKMNLCNIHTHTNAEHKGPGFSIFAGKDTHGGFKCNTSQGLTKRQAAMPKGLMTYKNVKPGDTIEVQWVFTTCDVGPGHGLAACSSEACANPQLRIESQVFLLVNDSRALDFNDFDYEPRRITAFHQPIRIPARTGTPVVFAGSTTGPKYNRSSCSPLQVTWSVRPRCAMLDINTLNAWGSDNVFAETQSHGVRPLVTALELLAPIE